MDKKIAALHTSCRECCFAIKDGKTQTGCEYDRVQQYHDNGVEVLEAYDEKDNEFYIINNKICPYHRDEEWAGQYSKSELKNIVESQIKLRLHAIIISDGSIDEDPSKAIAFKSSVDSLVSQETPPTLLTVISTIGSKQCYKENMAFSRILSPHSDKFDWEIRNVIDESLSTRSHIDLTIDSTKNKSYVYYFVVRSGFEVPEGFSSELTEAIYDKAKMPFFCYPVDSDLNMMLVHKTMHLRQSGNAFGINLEDKIIEFEKGSENFMFKIGEICPSCKA